MAAVACASAVSGEEYYRVYTDQPRILLRPQRLKLLTRERERQSIRWQRVADITNSPEQGFFNAFLWAVTRERDYARRAIQYAVSPGSDVRQSAIVLDWCGSEMTPPEKGAIEASLRTAAADTRDSSITGARNRVFAASAIASDAPAIAENTLRNIVTEWWRHNAAPALASGRLKLGAQDEFALYELLHVVRDNLNIDLREDAGEWFRDLAEWHILSQYPAPYPDSGTNYYIPAYPGTAPPDLRTAELSRIAGLSMVAYDNNAQDSQFLQGWLMQDSFTLKTAFGAPYEFFWANPYLPGLSYHHMPMSFHDPASGRIAVRSSWDENAQWLGRADGQLQLFSEGKTTLLNPSAQRPSMNLGPYRVFFGDIPSLISLAPDEVRAIVILGAPPGASYSVQGVKEHSYQAVADRAGNLLLAIAPSAPAVVKVTPARVRKAGH
jgi:hypothetical protein